MAGKLRADSLHPQHVERTEFQMQFSTSTNSLAHLKKVGDIETDIFLSCDRVHTVVQGWVSRVAVHGAELLFHLRMLSQ